MSAFGFWGALAALAAAAFGCGRSTRSVAAERTGGANATGGTNVPSGSSSGGSSSGVGGTKSQGGSAGNAGQDGGSSQGGDAGEAGNAGVSGMAGTGGAAGSDGCSSTQASCFEPCGGDPSGNWILETGCLTGDSIREGCVGGSIEGTPDELRLRLTFATDGTFGVSGREGWELAARVPLACLGLDDAQACDRGVLFTSPLLFATSRSLMTCAPGSCDSFCDCSAVVAGNQSSPGRWNAEGDRLTLETGIQERQRVSIPYCVMHDDVLWLGGDDGAGQSKVAYRLRKYSCTQTQPPCEARTQKECPTTEDCRWGSCLPSTGSAAIFCEGYDEIQCPSQDCIWEPNRCGWNSGPGCDFHRCEWMPGCVLGPPVARCAGSAWCGAFDVGDCTEPGCSVRTCTPNGDDTQPCANLYLNSCALAPGCSVNGESCQGTTHCTRQTDDNACSELRCNTESVCWGRPDRRCSDLPVSDCHTLPGCHVEW
jgi:hypothetical protein